MMIVVDWPNLLIGFGVGVVVSLVYFAGLAWSVRVALTSSRHAVVLLPSAVLRIGLLLTVGWLVTDGATLVWAAAGYGLAFFVVRSFVTFHARMPRQEDV